jgi:PTH1 family peptidyl-tRNA hydrolase
VLGRFSAAERPLLEEVLDEVLEGVELIRRLGLERAGNRLNSFRAGAQAS